MEKILKPMYEEPKLEITVFIKSDIITTSATEDDSQDVGTGSNVDNGGWTGSTSW